MITPPPSSPNSKPQPTSQTIAQFFAEQEKREAVESTHISPALPATPPPDSGSHTADASAQTTIHNPVIRDDATPADSTRTTELPTTPSPPVSIRSDTNNTKPTQRNLVFGSALACLLATGVGLSMLAFNTIIDSGSTNNATEGSTEEDILPGDDLPFGTASIESDGTPNIIPRRADQQPAAPTQATMAPETTTTTEPTSSTTTEPSETTQPEGSQSTEQPTIDESTDTSVEQTETDDSSSDETDTETPDSATLE